DIVLHNASMTIQGYPAYKQFISMYFTAFPDAQLTIEDMIAEGDTVAVRQTFHGTPKGDLMGIAPTGKQATTTGMSIFRVANGQAVEQWSSLLKKSFVEFYEREKQRKSRLQDANSQHFGSKTRYFAFIKAH